YFDQRPLDQLLGMEGNDVREIDYYNDQTGEWYAYFAGAINDVFPLLKQNDSIKETTGYSVPIAPNIQQILFGLGF
ncbi:MAG: hypothetical protein ACP5QU_02580, partial [Anaerolineae bacterium]